MIRVLATVLLGCLLLLSCGEESSSPETPVLYLDKDTVTMDVVSGTLGTASFVFRNIGEGLLEVEDLALLLRSGGANYPWDWLDVSPTSLCIEEGNGEPVTLTADATAQGTGTYRGSMTFSTNDPNNTSVSIPVTVHLHPNIQPEISLNPTSVELYLSGGESEDVTITVTNSGSAAGDVTSVSPECDWVSAEPTSLHLAPGQSGDIILTVTAIGLVSGSEYQCIVAFATPDPETPTITVTIVLTVVHARVVVAEEFTATWCTFCPGAMLGLHELEQQVERGKLAVVAYHLQDEFAIEGNDERAMLYDVSTIPDVWFDGVIHQIGGDESTSIDYTMLYEQRAATSAPMTLVLSVSDYNPTLGTGHIDAGMLNVSEASLELTVLFVLTCADTAYSWQGQSHLYRTAIGFIGGVHGYQVTLDPGDPEVTLQSDLVVPVGWIGPDLQIVAIAQDDETGEIHQGAAVDLQ